MKNVNQHCNNSTKAVCGWKNNPSTTNALCLAFSLFRVSCKLYAFRSDGYVFRYRLVHFQLLERWGYFKLTFPWYLLSQIMSHYQISSAGNKQYQYLPRHYFRQFIFVELPLPIDLEHYNLCPENDKYVLFTSHYLQLVSLISDLHYS